MVEASVRARVIGHNVYFCRMLRTTIGVLSDSYALAPSFDLKGRTQSSPTGYLERSEIAATRLFRDHDDWARATDTQSRPSVPLHGEEPYGKEFRYVNKPIKDPSR
jgi:hypothetical protein